MADPARKAALAKLAGEANARLKAGDLAAAAAAIEQLGTAADALASSNVSGAAQTTGAPAGAAVTYAKSRLAWLAARKKVEAELEKLRGEIMVNFEADGIAAELDTAYTNFVAPMLAALDESFADKLDEATNATDPAARAKLVEEAKAIMQRYETYLAGEPRIAALGTNPFVPLSIQPTLSSTLAALAKAVH